MPSKKRKNRLMRRRMRRMRMTRSMSRMILLKNLLKMKTLKKLMSLKVSLRPRTSILQRVVHGPPRQVVWVSRRINLPTR